MLTVQSYSMDADSESVQGIETIGEGMNRREVEDEAQLEFIKKWKSKKRKRKKLLERLRKRGKQ